ncbi:N-acetylglucosamine kinase [Leptolyngbya sp. FACHB-261]|uniref:N-acetylglucosamine kinase n=1 Tax=Leptolyngbya sp. FACHB-261 TaxID=2692806 RepID=UPI00168639C4|nr:BadF/BadG/BcrA/BcrD ATPase family protein [Leptolyngbya sp. FACHB-261]MBD2101905.1 ATPase [Leptolyngbya sp. FACHB-261]
MSYVLGIDGGGTKTTCFLLNDTGQLLGQGMAGPSNYQTVGAEIACNSIISAMQQATQPIVTQSISTIEIKALCLGLAGVGRWQDVQLAHCWIQQLVINSALPLLWSLQPSTTVICNDFEIALMGGLGHSVGVVVIAGTGSAIFGRNQQGMTRRVGGWGYLLGDEGSAYDIAIASLRAVLKSEDGRLGPTSLKNRLLQHLGLSNLADLVEVVYRRGWGAKEIAALAPLVDEAAAEGDKIATDIIQAAIRELALATQVVVKDLFSEAARCEVVLTGKVWQGRAKMQQQFEAALVGFTPTIQIVQPRHAPAYGAGLLALQALHRGVQPSG